MSVATATEARVAVTDDTSRTHVVGRSCPVPRPHDIDAHRFHLETLAPRLCCESKRYVPSARSYIWRVPCGCGVFRLCRYRVFSVTRSPLFSELRRLVTRSYRHTRGAATACAPRLAHLVLAWGRMLEMGARGCSRRSPSLVRTQKSDVSALRRGASVGGCIPCSVLQAMFLRSREFTRDTSLHV